MDSCALKMASNILNINGTSICCEELTGVSFRHSECASQSGILERSSAAIALYSNFVEIEISGALRGPSARSRARFLDELAKSGVQISISYGGHSGHAVLYNLRVKIDDSDFVPYRLQVALPLAPAKCEEGAIIDALIQLSGAQNALVELVRALARQAALSTEPSEG